MQVVHVDNAVDAHHVRAQFAISTLVGVSSMRVATERRV